MNPFDPSWTVTDGRYLKEPLKVEGGRAPGDHGDHGDHGYHGDHGDHGDTVPLRSPPRLLCSDCDDRKSDDEGKM